LKKKKKITDLLLNHGQSKRKGRVRVQESSPISREKEKRGVASKSSKRGGRTLNKKRKLGLKKGRRAPNNNVRRGAPLKK